MNIMIMLEVEKFNSINFIFVEVGKIEVWFKDRGGFDNGKYVRRNF